MAKACLDLHWKPRDYKKCKLQDWQDVIALAEYRAEESQE